LIFICVGKTQHDETGNSDHRFYASVRSRRRRIVLEKEREASSAPITQRRVKRVSDLRTVAAAVVETVHAPPAMTFLHAEQFQMPTARRFTLSCIHKKDPKQRAGTSEKPRILQRIFTCLAAECAGVPRVLGNFHLERSRAKSVFLVRGGCGPIFLLAPF